jgi:hypothetical protein
VTRIALFYKLRGEPSYVIDIPFSSTGVSTYDPSEISVPTGMTVIWFNDDDGDHSVTTVASNGTYTSPESFDSGPILTDGVSFYILSTSPECTITMILLIHQLNDHTSRNYLMQYASSGFTKPSASQISPMVLQNAGSSVTIQYLSGFRI